MRKRDVENYLKENPQATVEDVAVQFNVPLKTAKSYMPNRTYTSQEIVAMYVRSETLTASQLAEDIGKSYQYVARCLTEAGIDYKQRTEEMNRLKKENLEKQFLDLYEKNYPQEDMARILNVSTSTLHRMSKKLEVNLSEMRANRRHETIKKLISLRKEGKTYEEIGKTLGLKTEYALNLASRARKEGYDVPGTRAGSAEG